MDIFSNPTKVHGRVLWANPFTISHFPHESHWYWDVGRPEWVSGPIPTTAPWSRTGWPVGLHTGYQNIRLIPNVIYLTTEIYLTYYTEFPSLIGPYPSVYWSIHTPSPDYGLSHTNIPVQFYMYMVLFFTFQSRLRHISHHNESRIYLLFTRQIH